MIHSLLITVFPMVVAAVILMVGGVQLSKTTVAEITPHHKERLLTFSHSFQRELGRLEKLYLSHLSDLSQFHAERDTLTLQSESRELLGIHSIYLFDSEAIFEKTEEGDPARYRKISITKEPISAIPRVALDLPNFRANEAKVALPLAFLNEALPEDRGWIPTQSGFFKIHTEKPLSNILMAFVIDYPDVHRETIQSLTTWIKNHASPLVEANERVIVRSRLTPTPLLSSGPDHHGPSAAIIPYRSHLGDFEITAWDGITQKTIYDPLILTLSSVLALALCLTGFLLFSSHQRTVRLARQRVSFVNQVSHELGTPLTNLNLNLELADEFFEANPPESKKRLEIVKEEVTRLSRLVTNVLTFSQKERDNLKLHLEPCFPAGIISSAIDSFRPALDRLNFKIETDLPATPPLLLDPDALSQITTNLISNVEKYATSGKTLRVALEHKDDTLIVTLIDEGPGIPKSQESRIFEPFRRLSQDTTEGVSGMGLGLAIAHELAGRMNGTLELIPSSKGAHFQLTLPAK